MGDDTIFAPGGNDTIQDFQDNIDVLIIDQTFLNNADPDSFDFGEYVLVMDGNLYADFGPGNSLQINGYADYMALENDLTLQFM